MSNIRCDYYFYGSENETIEIKFTYFDVEGKHPCEAAETASDSVEFSNYMSRDRKFPFHCGKVLNLNLLMVNRFIHLLIQLHFRLQTMTL